MVGPSIKRLRQIKNFTQDELAQKLGVSRQAVCMWEAGRRELKATMLSKIAEVFEVTIGEIVRPQKMVVKKEEGMGMKGKQKKIDFELIAPQASKVSLTGDFTSWDEKGIKMKKKKNGLWQAGVNLRPGRYEYKFIVDGQWMNDPANDNAVANAFGSLNSVKELSA